MLRIHEIEDLAQGAAFLGTGGGGDPLIGRLALQNALSAGGQLRFIEADMLHDADLVVCSAIVGAPTIMIEKLPGGQEAATALERLQHALGRTAAALVPAEIGGINALLPLMLAAQTGLPVVNGDGMGRAFPRLEMVTFNIFGAQATPAALVNEHGDTVLIHTESVYRAETLVRSTAMAMGGSCFVCCYPMSGELVKQCLIRSTLEIALSVGRAITRARREAVDIVSALRDCFRTTDHYGAFRTLFRGKVIDIERKTEGGFTKGTAILTGEGPEQGPVTLTFQNEFLAIQNGSSMLAMVPDLICAVDQFCAEPVTVESLRYGQRLTLLGIGAPPILRTPEALTVIGPQVFGIAEHFIGIEQLCPQPGP